MSVRGRIWTVLDVLLRVPPVFVMDAILNYSLGLRNENIVAPHLTIHEIKDTSERSNSSSTEFEHDNFSYLDLPTLLWFLLYPQGKATLFQNLRFFLVRPMLTGGAVLVVDALLFIMYD